MNIGLDVAGTEEKPKGKSAEGAVILQDRFWVQDEESCDCHPGGWRATRRYVSAVRTGLYGKG